MLRRRRTAYLIPLLLAGCTADFAAPAGGVAIDGLDAGGAADAAALPEACLDALAAARFDFEDGPAGWTHDVMPEIAGTEVDWRFDDWEHGTATRVGPAACHAGTGCWATRLDNNYIACQRAYLVSPPLDLAACRGQELALTFQHAHDFWSGEWDGETWHDGGAVELSTDGETWSAPPGLELPGVIAINPRMGIYECIEPDGFYLHGRPGFVGGTAGWQEVEVGIPPDLVGAGLLVRFAYSSGVSLQSSTQNANSFSHAGWYLDDLAVIPAAAR